MTFYRSKRTPLMASEFSKYFHRTILLVNKTVLGIPIRASSTAPCYLLPQNYAPVDGASIFLFFRRENSDTSFHLLGLRQIRDFRILRGKINLLVFKRVCVFFISPLLTFLFSFIYLKHALNDCLQNVFKIFSLSFLKDFLIP